MAEKTERIDLDKTGDVDDVAISDVSMFRLERMTDETFWIAVYDKDNKQKRHVFWLTAVDGKITCFHEED